MAKKKSSKILSSRTENPFNIKVNRKKHSVLGQKVRGTRGMPGVSHSRGNAKRKEEFHKKKVQSRKANKFLDKRLLDSSQTYEDPATARLIQERKKKFKKNIFNLNDEEFLTHKGLPLLDDNNLNDEVVDSEDDEPLDSQYVKQAHFGGFSGNTARKSRKEIIDELIVESKRRKQEKKIAKDINDDLIEKLDQEWKKRHSSLPLLKAGKHKELPDKNDPFDVLLNELKFEKRTTPSSRLKTPEELARKEEEKLKKLEEERNKRMINPSDLKGTNNQLSADSIYDGIDIQFEPIEDQDIGNINETATEHSDDDDGGDDSSDASENENELIYNMENDDTESVPVLTDSYEIPVSLQMFRSVIDGQEEELYIIVENILNKVIKNKTKQNLANLETFFSVLIQYIMKEGENPNKGLDILDNILPHLYTLAEISPVHTAENLLAFLDEEQNFFQSSKGKKMKMNFPRFNCLVLFKIVSTVYSVSDFKHPVVTPAITFMCDILSSTYAVTFQNIFTRLFICKIIYNCVSFSKRYVSEVFWFLNKALELAVDSNRKFNLVIGQVVSEQDKAEVNFNISDKMCSDTIKVSILSEVIELICLYSLLYTHLTSYREIFSTVFNICNKLPVANYPNFLQEEIAKFTSNVDGVKQVYKPLMYENKKPVPLKMFEPAFDSKFTKRKDDIQKKRKLVKSVGQKIRKEEKGIVREMRRDNEVIASEKLREKIEADQERKRKVKQLYQELAMQEGEYKKFIKKK